MSKRTNREQREFDRMQEEYEDFVKYERRLYFRGYLERVGMVRHEEFSSEPRDFNETEH
jgi:hypothetical protein